MTVEKEEDVLYRESHMREEERERREGKVEGEVGMWRGEKVKEKEGSMWTDKWKKGDDV